MEDWSRRERIVVLTERPMVFLARNMSTTILEEWWRH